MHSTKRTIRSNSSNGPSVRVRRRVGPTPSPIQPIQDEFKPIKPTWAALASKTPVEDVPEPPKPEPKKEAKPLGRRIKNVLAEDVSAKKDEEVSVRRVERRDEEVSGRRDEEVMVRRVVRRERNVLSRVEEPRRLEGLRIDTAEQFPALSKAPSSTSSLSSSSPWSVGKDAIREIAMKAAVPKKVVEVDVNVENKQERKGLVARSLRRYKDPIIQKIKSPSSFIQRDDDEDCEEDRYAGGWDEGEIPDNYDDNEELSSEEEEEGSDYDDY